MKTKIIKMVFVLVCTISSVHLQAQDLMFFRCEDEYCTNQNITIVSVTSSTLTLYVERVARFQVVNKLKVNPRYYEDEYGTSRWETKKTFEYSASLSTSARRVYHYYQPASGWGQGMHLYYALSNDKSSLIEWSESDDGRSSHKYYSVRINKDDLLPNYDFLNE